MLYSRSVSSVRSSQDSATSVNSSKQLLEKGDESVAAARVVEGEMTYARYHTFCQVGRTLAWMKKFNLACFQKNVIGEITQMTFLF